MYTPSSIATNLSQLVVNTLRRRRV
uniref:Uncharacterized protein n=1 Tax=Amphimedon queenslandica TaxID=400682 RepID=A0A1X7TXH4_AMPQE